MINRHNSCVFLIDLQTKLTPLVANANKLITHCQWVIDLASELKVPIMVSEQYPQGLGETMPEVKQRLIDIEFFNKTCFSAMQCDDFSSSFYRINKNQVILIGIETHVCILQTAFDLINQEYKVYIVVDSVSSRKEIDYHYGLKRMKQAGCQLVTLEMLFFEWIGIAGTHEFRELSKKYISR